MSANQSKTQAKPVSKEYLSSKVRRVQEMQSGERTDTKILGTDLWEALPYIGVANPGKMRPGNDYSHGAKILFFRMPGGEIVPDELIASYEYEAESVRTIIGFAEICDESYVPNEGELLAPWEMALQLR